MNFTPKRIEKPWGYEIWWAENELYVGKILHVDEGKRLSWQYHEMKDETMYCLTGEAILKYENSDGVIVEERLHAGQSFRIRPPMKHRLIGGTGGCDVLEASTHRSKTSFDLKTNTGELEDYPCFR